MSLVPSKIYCMARVPLIEKGSEKSELLSNEEEGVFFCSDSPHYVFSWKGLIKLACAQLRGHN